MSMKAISNLLTRKAHPDCNRSIGRGHTTATMGQPYTAPASNHPQVNAPAAWMGPTRYTSFEELGTDLATLPSKTMQDPLSIIADKKARAAEIARECRLDAVIGQAKQDLAARLGVATDTIEITIRG